MQFRLGIHIKSFFLHFSDHIILWKWLRLFVCMFIYLLSWIKAPFGVPFLKSNPLLLEWISFTLLSLLSALSLIIFLVFFWSTALNHSSHKIVRKSCLPGVDPVGGSGPPEQLPQILSDTFPQDVTGALALFTAAHHKLVKIGGAVVHRLHGDDRNRTVAGKAERQERRSHTSFCHLRLMKAPPHCEVYTVPDSVIGHHVLEMTICSFTFFPG